MQNLREARVGLDHPRNLVERDFRDRCVGAIRRNSAFGLLLIKSAVSISAAPLVVLEFFFAQVGRFRGSCGCRRLPTRRAREQCRGTRRRPHLSESGLPGNVGSLSKLKTSTAR